MFTCNILIISDQECHLLCAVDEVSIKPCYSQCHHVLHQVWDIAYVQETHLCTLLVTLGSYIAYELCHLFYCTHVLIFGAQNKISNQKTFSWHFTNFHVSVKHWFCVHLGLLTLICFIIDYHVNKDIPFLLFRCVQPSNYF